MSELNLHPEHDHIVQALGLDEQVKMTAIRSTETVEEAMKLHKLSPMATVALGRFMTGLQLISRDMKNADDKLSASIKSDGPLKGMTAVAKQDGTVKGYVKEPVVETKIDENGKFDVAAAVGKGYLNVSRKQAGVKPYSGTVPLVSGEIAEDLTYYLVQSEQIPTILSLGVLLDDEGVVAAGGFIVQTLPEASDETIDYLEERIKDFPQVTALLSKGMDPADILKEFIAKDVDYLSVTDSGFECDCNKEIMENALYTLSIEDVKDLAQDEDGIDMICDFCSEKHHFSQAELETILKRKQEENKPSRRFNIMDNM